MQANYNFWTISLKQVCYMHLALQCLFLVMIGKLSISIRVDLPERKEKPDYFGPYPSHRTSPSPQRSNTDSLGINSPFALFLASPLTLYNISSLYQ